MLPVIAIAYALAALLHPAETCCLNLPEILLSKFTFGVLMLLNVKVQPFQDLIAPLLKI